MTKAEFLRQLELRLGSLAEVDRKRSLGYFNEMIDDRIEEGLSEEEAVAGLGSVEEVAAEILSESDGDTTATVKPRDTKTIKGYPLWLVILLAVLAAPIWLPVLIAVAAVGFSLYIIPWCLLLALYCTALGFIGGGIAGIAMSLPLIPFTGAYYAFMQLGAAFFLCGLGILLLYPCVYLTIWLGKGTGWCWRKLISSGKRRA